MYSGITLTNYSGHVLGVHQKIDRLAYRQLKQLTALPPQFPPISLILHFEGKNGPDGIKSKSTGKDEPWHFYDPFDPGDTNLLSQIKDHRINLAQELKQSNKERSAFEASWLAHALVDGLTPAHHFPYEAELEKLRGEGKDSRNSIRNKLIIRGEGLRDTARRNWTMWGAKGLLTSHILFELGVASLMIPMRLRDAQLRADELQQLLDEGMDAAFQRTAREVAVLSMYERFLANGWTGQLSNEVRHELAPRLVKIVTLAWYSCLADAGLVSEPEQVPLARKWRRKRA